MLEAQAAAPLRVSQRGTVLPGLRRGLPAAAVAVSLIGLAANQGGYFPTAWGWASLAFLWAATVALVVRSRLWLSRREAVFLASLMAFTAWLAASTIWSVAPAQSAMEVHRALVYLGGCGVAVLALRSRFVSPLLFGLAAGVSLVAAFSLATRLFPDRIGVFDGSSIYRLSQPIGYWNGLALFTAMGALLALGFAARAPTALGRATCAALLVLLLPTFYFTFSRAGWFALAGGLVVMLAVDPRRLQLLTTLLVVGPAPAAAVWLASREHGLTTSGAALVRAASDGHRLALVLALLAAVNAAACASLVLLERRIEVAAGIRHAFAGVVILAIACGLALVFARYGGPQTLVEKGYASFKVPLPRRSTNLNARLLSFSGNGRTQLWSIAWKEAQRHPYLGAGAGTYERYFLAHQPRNVSRVRDAHGLYVETLAELGPIGLALLLAFLAVPFAAVSVARRHPLVPAALGAYAAYVAHTGVDWDWELPAVTLTGLLCGTAVLVTARRQGRTWKVSIRSRWAGAALALAASAFAAIGLAGNSALSAGKSALEHRDWPRAASDAREARAWTPWAPAPWTVLGRAQLGAGFVPQARTSFEKAISKDPGDWSLWYDLARASSGRARKRALQQATALYPQSGLLAGSAPVGSRSSP